MHSLYRGKFNAIDVFNKQAVGGHSLVNVWGTKTWWVKVLASFIGMCETNAYLAYKHCVENIPRYAFREKLAHQLIHWDARTQGPERPLGATDEHCMLYSKLGKARCVVCQDLTKVRCKCGTAVCNPLKRAAPNNEKAIKDTACYYLHVLGVLKPKKKRRVAPAEDLQLVVLS